MDGDDACLRELYPAELDALLSNSDVIKDWSLDDVSMLWEEDDVDDEETAETAPEAEYRSHGSVASSQASSFSPASSVRPLDVDDSLILDADLEQYASPMTSSPLVGEDLLLCESTSPSSSTSFVESYDVFYDGDHTVASFQDYPSYSIGSF